jgi:glycine oxidase
MVYSDKTEGVLDALVVGFGIAGAVMSRTLHIHGKRFAVIADPASPAASMASAGIMNPVTGKKFLLSWRFAEWLDTAVPFYNTWLDEIGMKDTFHPVALYRMLSEVKQINDWDARCGTPGYEPYMAPTAHPDVIPALRAMETTRLGPTLSAWQLPVARLLEAWQAVLQEKGCYAPTAMDYSKLVHTGTHWEYGNWRSERVIFCEGSAVLLNPFFSYLPVLPNRGDVLLVRIPDFPARTLVKKNVFIVPWQPDASLFWVGSTYQRDLDSDPEGEASRLFLEAELEGMLTQSWETIGQMRGVRPTVPDRRPLIGGHPEHRQLFVLNGLGTKGASIAPSMADQLYQHMFHDADLSGEVSVRRYDARYKG